MRITNLAALVALPFATLAVPSFAQNLPLDLLFKGITQAITANQAPSSDLIFKSKQEMIQWASSHANDKGPLDHALVKSFDYVLRNEYGPLPYMDQFCDRKVVSHFETLIPQLMAGYRSWDGLTDASFDVSLSSANSYYRSYIHGETDCGFGDPMASLIKDFTAPLLDIAKARGVEAQNQKRAEEERLQLAREEEARQRQAHEDATKRESQREEQEQADLDALAMKLHIDVHRFVWSKFPAQLARCETVTGKGSHAAISKQLALADNANTKAEQSKIRAEANSKLNLVPLTSRAMCHSMVHHSLVFAYKNSTSWPKGGYIKAAQTILEDGLTPKAMARIGDQISKGVEYWENEVIIKPNEQKIDEPRDPMLRAVSRSERVNFSKISIAGEKIGFKEHFDFFLSNMAANPGAFGCSAIDIESPGKNPVTCK